MATASHLRFDIGDSSLPEFIKTRLLALVDQRLSKDGVIVIKAQTPNPGAEPRCGHRATADPEHRWDRLFAERQHGRVQEL